MALATVHGTQGMVTAPHFLAAQAGLDVLRDGGNAVEASIAVAACLAVVYPHMTGIGGDGFWLIAEPDGRVHSIHGCGGAAAAADLSLYAGLDAVPTRGPLAANTVAGTISAWAAALESSGGKLPLDRLLRDAIHHAKAGVAVTAGGAAIAAGKGDELRIQPGGYAAIFERDRRPLREGEMLSQPLLAHTLARLAHEGLASFYAGALADDIAADLATLGSPVSAADLAAHVASRPEPLSTTLTSAPAEAGAQGSKVAPLGPGLLLPQEHGSGDGQIAGATLYNSAPPTQGFASLLILALFNRLAANEADGFAHVHGLVEATKQAFLLRDDHVGDPAYHDFDLQGLLDDSGALEALAAKIDPRRALPWPQPASAGDTCWFGVADGEGRVVSAIQSTYHEFGSGIVLPRTGITWQNRGSSFRLAPDGWNALKPGRKPFHTLNPALARFDDGRVIAYGTMGGEGQPQTQAAIFTRYARYGVDLQEAISRPRWLLGRTWGAQSTTLKLEDGFDEALYADLAAAGHDVERVGPLTSMMGHAAAIVRHADGRLEGATDPRSDGLVASW